MLLFVFSFESASEQQCAQETGTYLSVAACLAYFFCSVLLCCVPRPDPFCCAAPERIQRQTTKITRTTVKESPEISHTPAPAPAPAPSSPKKEAKKRNAKVAKKEEKAPPPVVADDPDQNIDDEEFDESPPPPEGAQRVDVKEKAFPDGSREVTETTYFKDGSRAVRTIVHYPDGSKSEKTQVFDD
jgi:hypothetical protein